MIAIIGMAVMGQNLALNIAGKGFPVTVFNRTTETTERFFRERVNGVPIRPTSTLEECIQSLEKPRRVMLMVKAGQAVDTFCQKLYSLLGPGDVIIDGGNSHFTDTNRRVLEAERRGLFYLGTGISGGEEGALSGPSIMPGGHRDAYEAVQNILEKSAAQAEDGPCCTYLGPESAGHFVKMVHNGIEYAFMQAIAECYDLLSRGCGLPAGEIGDIFHEWNATESLGSYLVEITWKILKHRDQETGQPLIDLISDQAEQKGTGKWSSQAALDLGVPIPAITASVVARTLSSYVGFRKMGTTIYQPPVFTFPPRAKLIDSLGHALFLAQTTAFSEGMHLLAEASREFAYRLPLSEVPRIWKGGCIIRSRLLKRFQSAFASQNTTLLIHSPEFRDDISRALDPLREVVATAIYAGIPAPLFSASLGYLDGFCSQRLPSSLIQAQRDFFGAHAFRRIDREGIFHEQWGERDSG